MNYLVDENGFLENPYPFRFDSMEKAQKFLGAAPTVYGSPEYWELMALAIPPWIKSAGPEYSIIHNPAYENAEFEIRVLVNNPPSEPPTIHLIQKKI